MNENLKKFFRGFVYASRGIVCCVRTQRNMRFHICAAGAVIFLGAVCGFGCEKLVLLILAVSSVMAAEGFNTAVEYAVDLCTRERSVLAERAKDCAAGAVLIASVWAAAAGIILFGNTETLTAAAEWFAAESVRIPCAGAYIVLSFLFVFVYGGEK